MSIPWKIFITLRSNPKLNIIAMLVLVAVVLVSAVALCWYEFSLFGKAQKWLNHTYRILTSLERLESTLWDAETHQRGFLITGKESYKISFEKSSKKIEFQLGQLRERVSDNPIQTERVDRLRALIGKKIDNLEQGNKIRVESGLEVAQRLLSQNNDEEISIDIRRKIETIEKREREQELRRIDQADQSAKTLLIELAALSLVSMGLFAGMAFTIKRYADEKQRLSLVDEMTGIYNRRGFLTLIGPVLKLAKRHGKLCSLIFVDMDGLKPINDNLGHDAGNQAIMDMADVLRESFRGEDIVARWGGDEFVIFAFGTEKEEKSDLRAKFQGRLDQKIEKTKPPYKLSASLGIISVDPKDISAESIAEVVHRADMDMYNIKKAKKSS